MSDTATDTRNIAKRMKRWVPPTNSFKSSDVPDSEYLRVHALRLADRFVEVRENWHQSNREGAAKDKRISELEAEHAAALETLKGLQGKVSLLERELKLARGHFAWINLYKSLQTL